MDPVFESDAPSPAEISILPPLPPPELPPAILISPPETNSPRPFPADKLMDPACVVLESLVKVPAVRIIFPPLALFVLPVDRSMSPLDPLKASPDSSFIRPVEACLPKPVFKSIDPLLPADPPFGVWRSIPPLDPLSLPPDKMDTIPPSFSLPDPPAFRKTPPGRPELAIPALTNIPPLPPAATPVRILIEPDLSDCACPVCMETFPLLPASPDSGVKSLISPLLALRLLPVAISILPPLPVAASPALTVMDPPSSSLADP